MIERAYSDLKELLHTRKYKEMSSALAVSYLFKAVLRIPLRTRW